MSYHITYVGDYFMTCQTRFVNSLYTCKRPGFMHRMNESIGVYISGIEDSIVIPPIMASTHHIIHVDEMEQVSESFNMIYNRIIMLQYMVEKAIAIGVIKPPPPTKTTSLRSLVILYAVLRFVSSNTYDGFDSLLQIKFVIDDEIIGFSNKISI